jgi:glutamyl-Q tRNA(Asp) synthetase
MIVERGRRALRLQPRDRDGAARPGATVTCRPTGRVDIGQRAYRDAAAALRRRDPLQQSRQSGARVRSASIESASWGPVEATDRKPRSERRTPGRDAARAGRRVRPRGDRCYAAAGHRTATVRIEVPLTRTRGVPRGRFAPSPTGPLHFGSLVAALASYCDARARGGEWLVRIEDVDEPRSRPDAERAILSTLARFGFAWDGPVVRQSQRTASYEDTLATLRADGLAYPCACTRRELEIAPIGRGGERVYPGTCRNGVPDALAARPARAWRVRVDDAVIAYVDRLQGPQRQALATDVGDFVVRRADGLFAYQLAVVVDDAAQGITDVVRGADLLASTPRQILLQRVLGLPHPTYLHVAVAVDAHGEKLSKQTRAPALGDDPVPALVAAWRFLDQPELPRTPRDASEFWQHATSRWNAARLPPVSMLPSPAKFAAP